MRQKQPPLFDNSPAPTPWELADDEDRLVAQVVFNRPLDTIYHYDVPDALREMIGPGQRVRAPFGRGNTPTNGYCVGLAPSAGPGRQLKTLLEVCDRVPLLSQSMLELTRWISERYLCSWGQVLDTVVPAGVRRQAGTREVTCFEAAPGIDLTELQLPAKQRRLLEILMRAPEPMSADELTQAGECGTSPLTALTRKRLILPRRRRTRLEEGTLPEVPSQPDLQLNDSQQKCVEKIVELLRAQRHATVLIHGVTGSGKTEVYIQAIREVVSYGRQAIVLVPEISLTPQTIRRFRSRFPYVSVLHSHLSDADRHWHWQQIARGDVQVVVGARSAIFAPLPHLGLIVIDEEHETTFKQQATPRYHAREVARERARREGVPLVLGSATPTLESLLRAQEGIDELLRLPARVESRPLPRVTLVDTRNDPLISKRHSIGRALGQAVNRALAEQGQVILFLNLRGFSPLLWCLKCGGVRCPDCDITLTWHRDRGQLLCHGCEYECPPPERCPTCGQPGLRHLGAGTQKLEAEARVKFPDARIVRMDSDAMRKPGSHDAALEAFRNGKVNLLLGTQMIAKGLDFPNVTLVGVIDADTLLHQPDLRAAERTFQLISQVAGRTGRGEREGRVLVQTMSPDEPVIQLAARHDYEGFARLELAHRQRSQAPPYTHLARVILRSEQESLVQEESRRIVQMLRNAAEDAPGSLRILGPAPAPLRRLRKHYRYHAQMTSVQSGAIHQLWKRIAAELDLHPEVELTIDVDPTDLR